MKRGSLYLLAASALTCAITTLATALLHINTGLNGGYIHLGDAFVYLGACLLPQPWALLSASLGGVLADFFSGAAAWMLPTAIIKAANTLVFSSRGDKILTRRNICFVFVSGCITIVGYFLAESLLYSFPGALAGLIPGVLQAVGSTIVFFALGAALDRIGLKGKIERMVS